MIRTDTGVFMDRDGLINVPPPPEDRYILHPDTFKLMPGIAEAIRLLNERNIPVAVVTNQKGVAIGKVSEATLHRIHQRMVELLAAENASVQHIQYCPHREEDQCNCRKPLPGMLIKAAAALNLQTETCWMIGDQPRDLEAGRAAGCRTLLVGSATAPEGLADLHLSHTQQLPHWIKQNFPFQTER
ncbi:HAD family hydrolase [Kiritimatiellaeota bacterium B1221]|nr:HAD family hydrolase [Kiritimatiellaeota bacterium B1221]